MFIVHRYVFIVVRLAAAAAVTEVVVVVAGPEENVTAVALFWGHFVIEM